MTFSVYIPGYGRTIIFGWTRIDGESFLICAPSHEQMEDFDRILLSNLDFRTLWNGAFDDDTGRFFTVGEDDNLYFHNEVMKVNETVPFVSRIYKTPLPIADEETGRVSETFLALLPLDKDGICVQNGFQGYLDGEVVEGGSLYLNGECVAPDATVEHQFQSITIGNTSDDAEKVCKWVKFRNALYSLFTVYDPVTIEGLIQKFSLF